MKKKTDEKKGELVVNYQYHENIYVTLRNAFDAYAEYWFGPRGTGDILGI